MTHYVKTFTAVCTLAMFSVGAYAQATKVIVIPMGGNDAISHPVAATYTNTIDMRFNQLPKGSFTMGSPDGSGSEPAEPGRDGDEAEHTVTLSKAFRMQVTEVTNAQWNVVLSSGTNPSTSHSGDEYPVENVSWYDAVYFANSLSQAESRSLCYTLTPTIPAGTVGTDLVFSSVTMNANCKGYRLPTEAEWEYAARAMTIKAYANPINFDNLDIEEEQGFNGNLNAMGWYGYNEAMYNDTSGGGAAYATGTKPVAKKQANAWDLYDMHGNVAEWVQDWWNMNYSGSVTDPVGPNTGLQRVVRGGYWASHAKGTRSAERNSALSDYRNDIVGFRLVLLSD